MIKKSRNIINVVENIILNVEDENLKNDLFKFAESLLNIAPECLHTRHNWLRLHEIMLKHIDYRSKISGWKKKAVDIYVGN